jgi:hypothetical protein
MPKEVNIDPTRVLLLAALRMRVSEKSLSQ